MEAFDFMKDVYLEDYHQFGEAIDRRRKDMLNANSSFLEDRGIVIDLDAATNLPNGRFNISHKGIIFECLLHCKADGPLYVILNGALTNIPPQFSRWSYYTFLNGTMLNIADPMYRMYKDLKLGWYYGDSNYDLRIYLAEVVKKVAAILEIEDRNIVFLGSSGGGAATFECAFHIKGSRAVAINPQIVLSEYNVYADEFERITKNDLKKDEIWNRNNAIYYLKNAKENHCFLIVNLRSPLDMRQIDNICIELGISLKYGLNVFEHFTIWLYDAECEPYVSEHCTQEYYCIFFVIEFLLDHINDNCNYERLIELVNEFWFYHWKSEKELRNKIPDIKRLIQCREHDKKNIIWGIGEISKTLAKELFDINGTNDYKIQMAIDSDLNKRNYLKIKF